MPAGSGRAGGLGRGAARPGVGRDGRPVHDGGEVHHPAAAGQARRSAGGGDGPRGRLPDRGAVMFSGSLRTRLALLYGGVFLVLALVVLAIPFLAVSETTHVGSTAPPVISHPGQNLLPQVTIAIITLAIAVAASLG